MEYAVDQARTKIIVPARLQSIDVLRGLVMIIMALDHVRDYFHADAFLFSPTDLSQTTPVLFFTRWITHFCAPVFVFLAGTSIYLMSQKKSKSELSVFLLKRGLWLILLDVIVFTFGWNFDIQFHLFFLNVIWMFGISMIVLAALIHFHFNVIMLFGLVLVFGHNLLNNVHAEGNTFSSFLWAVLHEQTGFDVGKRTIFIAYPVIPWVGVMALGYCLGKLYATDYNPSTRRRTLIRLGVAAIGLFILLRAINVYGDGAHWEYQATPILTVLSFLNPWKYPPSLLYLLMTLGPALLFLGVTENMKKAIADPISVFGRVPLFFYIAHLYLIHFLALIAVGFFPGRDWTDMILIEPLWFTQALKGYGFSLAIVYIIWMGVVVSLYPLCRWYDKYKRDHRNSWWLSYI
jgi:uncharacterized membrane protein